MQMRADSSDLEETRKELGFKPSAFTYNYRVLLLVACLSLWLISLLLFLEFPFS